jgi:hypothetical protein
LLYRILADFVVLTHLAFIAFALFGGLFALRWPRVTRVHVPAALWAAVVAFFGWLCPLTPIENALRRAAGSAEYTVGFIEHYVVPVIYPAELTRELQVFLGFVVLVVNSTIYLVVWRRLRVDRVRDSLNG